MGLTIMRGKTISVNSCMKIVAFIVHNYQRICLNKTWLLRRREKSEGNIHFIYVEGKLIENSSLDKETLSNKKNKEHGGQVDKDYFERFGEKFGNNLYQRIGMQNRISSMVELTKK